jgi:lipopolysaccharide transport system ATP-binding protein
MSEIAVRVENVSKRYRIGMRNEMHDSFVCAMVDFVKRPLANLKRLRKLSSFDQHSDDCDDIIWALRDVSFEVKRGEVVGIIGNNGSGKSTLLKIISRVTEPTKGRGETNGRVGSLLEVGTGFHPELTGRENIFLNGAVLGMKKVEIAHKFDAIVDFSGVEKFIDTPVKRYSSGMYVRLAFAVAAHLEPEILLVDEVLAVGDAAFQKKCLGKMGDVAKEGRTVLFVSHNMAAVRGLCQRGIWINQGSIVDDGESQKVIPKYLNAVTEGLVQGTTHDEEVIIENIVFRNARGKKTRNFTPGDDLVIEVHFQARRRIRKPHFWVSIIGQYGSLFGATMLLDGHCPEYIEGNGMIACIFKSVPLVPQLYTVRMGVRGEDGMTLVTTTKDVGFFNVMGKMKDVGFSGKLAEVFSWGAIPMVIPYEWRLPDGQVASVKINRSYNERGNEDEVAG